MVIMLMVVVLETVVVVLILLLVLMVMGVAMILLLVLMVKSLVEAAALVVVDVAAAMCPLHSGPILGCGDFRSAGQYKLCINKEPLIHNRPVPCHFFFSFKLPPDTLFG